MSSSKRSKNSAATESDLARRYKRGQKFFEQRQREIERSDLIPDAWESLAKGAPARGLMEAVASHFGVTFEIMHEDAMFAAAVESIVMNCGEMALQIIFDKRRPQTRQAVMKLSRTADTRQRYRVEGVLDGRFRSIAPQNEDCVYDTVSFSEVPSRLARARGALHLLGRELANAADTAIAAECRRLTELCRLAAEQLLKLIRKRSSGIRATPKRLSKEFVWPIFTCRKVRGGVVGKARLALRLTIKSVWDFPEMQLRGILPAHREREKTNKELAAIVEIADSICSPGALQALPVNAGGTGREEGK